MEHPVPLGTSASIARTIDASAVHAYERITGDLGGGVADDPARRGAKIGRPIGHGALLVGFMGAAAARVDLGAEFVTLGYDRVRFVAPVFFGDTITTDYVVCGYDDTKGRVYADVTCRNQHGEIVAAAVNVRQHLG